MRQRLRASFVLLFGCLAIAHNIAISAVTVEEAYRSIPHRYTPFESKGLRMSQHEATFLSEFFRLINLAIVARVQAQDWLHQRKERLNCPELPANDRRTACPAGVSSCA